MAQPSDQTSRPNSADSTAQPNDEPSLPEPTIAAAQPNARPAKPRTWPVLLAGVALGAAIGWVVFFVLPARAEEPASPTQTPRATVGLAGLSIGSSAPAFELQQAGGQPVSLEQLRGNVVVLNFWATWCAPCRVEMPLLQSVADRHADDGLTVLGVNFDESEEQVLAFADELSLDFPLLLDPGGAVQELYQVRGYPTTAFVDRQGSLAAYHIGILTEDQLDGYLQQAGMFE